MNMSSHYWMIASVVASLALWSSTVAGLSTLGFPGLFDGETVAATLLDESSQTLYVTSNPTGFSSASFSIFRVDSSGNRDYKATVPFRSGRRFENPTFLALLHDSSTLVVITNGGYSDSGGGDCAITFLNATSGVTISDVSTVILTGPDFLENGQTTNLITCEKLVQSTADSTKIYVMATSLMNIDNAAYGYSVFKIDIPSKTVDWVSHYLPSGSDGGSPNDILEVNSNYLLVGGFIGLFRYELSTGSRTDILTNTRINNLLQVGNLIVVGAAGSDSSTALDATTLTAQWSTPEGRGIAYHAPGPNSDTTTTTVWYTKNLIPEASENWNIEVGVISLADGSVQWSQVYDGGSNLFDAVVGFHSVKNKTIAYLGSSDRSQTAGCFANLFGLLSSRAIIGDARLLTVDHASAAIVDTLVETSIGAPKDFLSTDAFGWMISFDGSAIQYNYS
jgi:hypothetical protein